MVYVVRIFCIRHIIVDQTRKKEISAQLTSKGVSPRFSDHINHCSLKIPVFSRRADGKNLSFLINIRIVPYPGGAVVVKGCIYSIDQV